MPSKYQYQQQISNAYLGEVKIIKGATPYEVQQRVAQQLARWREQEARRREQDRLLDMQAKAEGDTWQVQKRITALRELLFRGLKASKEFDWNALKNHKPYQPFQFSEVPPTYLHVSQTLGVPAKYSLLEAIFSGLRKKREALEAQAHETFTRLTAEYERRKADALRHYQEQRQAYEKEKALHNAKIKDRQEQFETGDASVVTWFLGEILKDLQLPEDFGADAEAAFDASSGIAVITMQLPNPVEIPKISSYKFIKTRRVVEPVELKPKDLEAFYDSVIQQIALLTIYRVFFQAYTPALRSVVFNGWVTGIDRATGNEFTSCILSIQAERQAFQAINLERVDPKECIRSLKGLVAGPLAQLAPVRPIMELNTDDKRFIESREILANLNSTDNLATMDWADFEHLVRELFSRVFGGEGSQVKVTQASRDGGVDAIAFDPDPIRGGKFVIQAKRYNIVVPVSAVRDLYGTMINEGAVKGILVTTSYYGNDSREFAKDKPITLIDGSNLVQMFQQHGYNVRIDLQK